MKHRAVYLTGLLLVLCACGDTSPSATDDCPVLPGVRAVAAIEHRPSAVRGDTAVPGMARWPEYVLRADSGYALLDTGVVRLCGVHLVVNDSLGRRTAELTAAGGEFDRAREVLVARGSVVVELPLEGRRLQTEELHYAPREDRVWSPTETTFQQEGATLRGDSFTANRRFTDITVQGARGRFQWR